MTASAHVSRFAVLAAVSTAHSCTAPAPHSREPMVESVPSRAGADSPPPPRDDGRLPATFTPLRYAVHLDVDPGRDRFSGRVDIEGRVEAPTRHVVLHARELDVRRATLRDSAGRVREGRVLARPDAHGKGTPEELVVSVEEPVAPGEAALSFEYSASFADGLRGLYRVEANGAPYSFTQMEPMDARRVLPCFDDPKFKVPFAVTLTVPEGMTAVANMPEASRARDGNRRVFTFQETPPIPTYLLAFAVGSFDFVEHSSSRVPTRLVTTKGRATEGSVALAMAAEHLAILERTFGSPYPYPKLDLLAVPNFAAGAMENPGLVTFREERLLVSEASPESLFRQAALTMAHELAHMWFGNLVTPRWWDDIWLNESFATYVGNQVVDEWRPELGTRESALGWQAKAMNMDTLASARAVRQPVRGVTEAFEAFDGITYAKGMALLEMTADWVGTDAFLAGVRAYLEAHAWKTATSADLFAAIGRSANRDVQSVLDTFTTQPGVPSISTSWSCQAKALTVRVAQSPHRPKGAPEAPKRWNVPVCFRYGTPSTEGRHCVLLEGPSSETNLEVNECPTWFVPNADSAGYYHAAASAANLKALSSNAGRLTPRERIGTVVDAWASVESGGLSITDYLDFLSRFAPGSRSAVWESVAPSLETIHDWLAADADLSGLNRYVRALTRRDARALGWKAAPNEPMDDGAKRKVLLVLLGNVGEDAATIAEAEKTTAKWLAAPDSVDADVAEIAVTIAGAHADATLVTALLERASSSPNPEQRVTALQGLGAVRDATLATQVLDATRTGAIRTQDFRYLYPHLFASRAPRPAVRTWIGQNIADLVGRLPPFAARMFASSIAAHCDAESGRTLHALLSPHLSQVEGADRALDQSMERGGRCAALRAHVAGELARAFAR